MLQRFGLFPVRSPLLGESRLISVPAGTEMFQFPALASFRMTELASSRVSPFGHPEITARVQLPQAYRSLPRPSSPLDAKASTVCLIAFDLKFFSADARCDTRIRPVLIPYHEPGTEAPDSTPSVPSIVKEQQPPRGQPRIRTRPRDRVKRVKHSGNRESAGDTRDLSMATTKGPLLDAPERR